jgi:ribonucleases P/MRP protein subunit RPP40
MREDSKIMVAVFLDFKMAFETIDRELILRRMEQYSIKGAELSWFRNYLSQETKFYEKISDAINVQLGVPQGSVLGPLLFIFYINDIKNVLRYSKLNLFAAPFFTSLLIRWMKL